MDAAFRLHYCKEDLAEANLRTVRLQEISNIAELEAEITAGPMFQDDADLKTDKQIAETEDVGRLGAVNVRFFEGSFPINI
jgi:hypothetical protein